MFPSVSSIILVLKSRFNLIGPESTSILIVGYCFREKLLIEPDDFECSFYGAFWAFHLISILSLLLNFP